METSQAALSGSAATSSSSLGAGELRHRVPSSATTETETCISSPEQKNAAGSWSSTHFDNNKDLQRSTQDFCMEGCGFSKSSSGTPPPTDSENGGKCCLPSKLDFFDPKSDLSGSSFRGFATLLCPSRYCHFCILADFRLFIKDLIV